MNVTDRIDHPAVTEARRIAHASGHKLTYRRLASVADGIALAGSPESSDRAALLAQATSQFLRTKRAKAADASAGHYNGRRNYSGRDKVAARKRPGTARVHGSPVSTRANVA